MNPNFGGSQSPGFSQLDRHNWSGYRPGRGGYHLSGGIQSSIVIDAPTFLLSALLLWQLKHLPSHGRVGRGRHPHQSLEDQQATFVDLLRFLQQDKDFLWLILKNNLMAIFSYNPAQVLHILLSKLYPHVGPGSLLLGVIFSVGEFVSFFSPTVVRLFTVNNHSRMRKAMLLDYFASA